MRETTFVNKLIYSFAKNIYVFEGILWYGSHFLESIFWELLTTRFACKERHVCTLQTRPSIFALLALHETIGSRRKDLLRLLGESGAWAVQLACLAVDHPRVDPGFSSLVATDALEVLAFRNLFPKVRTRRCCREGVQPLSNLHATVLDSACPAGHEHLRGP